MVGCSSLGMSSFTGGVNIMSRAVEKVIMREEGGPKFSVLTGVLRAFA